MQKLKPFTANVSSGTTIVTCNVDELISRDEVKAVGRFIEDLTHFKQHIVIDFNGLSRATSELLGYLVSLRHKCVKAELKLALCNLGDGMREAFKITGFTRLFSVHDSLDQARFEVGDRSEWVNLDQHEEVAK